MSAVVIAGDALEALQLLEALLTSAGQVSTAIRTAAATNAPIDLKSIQTAVDAAQAAATTAVNNLTS